MMSMTKILFTSQQMKRLVRLTILLTFGVFVNNLGHARTLFTKTSSIAYQSEMLLRERDNASYKTSMTSLEQEDTFAERQTDA